jgi:cobalt/nickel transport protein
MKHAVLVAVFIAALNIFVAGAHAAEERWPGVDDTVVGKYAEEHGRAPKPNLIDLEGDSLLFAFLIAGAVGGFTMGYYYRDLTGKKPSGGDADAG